MTLLEIHYYFKLCSLLLIHIYKQAFKTENAIACRIFVTKSIRERIFFTQFRFS